MGTAFIWTATTMSDALRNTIGDPGDATVHRWTDDDLDTYLIRGVNQVVLETDYELKTSWRADLVDGQREYALPPEYIMAEAVFLVRTGNPQVGEVDSDIVKLDYVPFNVFQTDYLGSEDDSGEPVRYTFWRKLGADPDSAQQPGVVILHPTPDTAAAALNGGGDNLRIYGSKMPDTIDKTAAADATVELPPLHVEAAIFWAAMLIFTDDGDHAGSDRMEAKYNRQIEKITAQLTREDTSKVSRLIPKGARRGNVSWPDINW